MHSEIKNQEITLEALKAFKRKHNRVPSIRELGDSLGWKKSITNKYLNKLIKVRKVTADFDEKGNVISKSWRPV